MQVMTFEEYCNQVDPMPRPRVLVKPSDLFRITKNDDPDSKVKYWVSLSFGGRVYDYWVSRASHRLMTYSHGFSVFVLDESGECV